MNVKSLINARKYYALNNKFDYHERIFEDSKIESNSPQKFVVHTGTIIGNGSYIIVDIFFQIKCFKTSF